MNPTPRWRREPVVDALLAAGIAVFTLLGVIGELAGAGRPTPPAAGGWVLALVGGAALAWRRRRPAVVAVATLAVVAVYHLSGYPGEAVIAPVFVALYSLAGYGATVRSLVGAVTLTAIAYVVPILPPYAWAWNNPAVYAPAISLLWVVLLGTSVRHRRVETEARVRERLAEDRLRIAQELHDVLAHTISVISVHSGVALDAVEVHDEPAVRAAVTTIRAATKQAASELRATLGLLRADPGTRPQPKLAELPEVVARARDAGLDVSLHCEPGGELPPVVELTAYRIVQEALTNVLRHANARTVTVDVRRVDTTLRIEVIDDGHGTPGPPTEGLGLTGMRERTHALGGTFRAGSGTDNGFHIEAALPL